MLARCGRVAHICEANQTYKWNYNKNLGANRKNRNCLQNQKVVMREQGFRGNCDSQGKLGMCPSLAEPDSGGFSKTSRRRLKSFSVQQFFKNAAEVWASSPHLRSKSNCTMKENKNLRENRKNRNCLLESEGCKYGTRFQGQLRFPRQAGDVPQPCRTRFGWFS